MIESLAVWPPKKVVCVGAVVLRGEESALLVHQAKGTSLEGQWSIPWGIVEADEYPEKAVLREIHEEGGITAELMGLLGIQNLSWKSSISIIFLCSHVAGEPKSDGGTETDQAGYFSLSTHCSHHHKMQRNEAERVVFSLKLMPNSLAGEIMQMGVDWSSAAVIDTKEFYGSLTLHDSHWIGLHIDTGWKGEATAIIRLDPIWNDVGIAPTGYCYAWPIILIRFCGATNIAIRDYHDIGGIRRGLYGAETMETDSGHVRTVFTDHYGGEVAIEHDDLLEVLLYQPDGQKHNVPYSEWRHRKLPFR